MITCEIQLSNCTHCQNEVAIIGRYFLYCSMHEDIGRELERHKTFNNKLYSDTLYE